MVTWLFVSSYACLNCKWLRRKVHLRCTSCEDYVQSLSYWCWVLDKIYCALSAEIKNSLAYSYYATFHYTQFRLDERLVGVLCSVRSMWVKFSLC